MTENKRASILGLGVFLPEEVRTNEWWPAPIVDRWRAQRARRLVESKAAREPKEASEGEALVRRALEKYESDPFNGVVTRRVVAEDMSAADMGAAAAREALADANTKPGEIDAILAHALVPSTQITPDAIHIHHQLGLRSDCLTMGVDATCNSFIVHLMMAEDLIRAGRAKKVLIVQSTASSRVSPIEAPFSAWFGDAGSAAVVGPAEDEGSGVLASCYRINSARHNMMEATVRGGRWWENGPVEICFPDVEAARGLVMESADGAKETVETALRQANLEPRDVDFYGIHSATPWIADVSMAHIGLENATTVNTYPWAGNVAGCCIPLTLVSGRKEGMLKPGALVALQGGGAGSHWAAAIVRWGRA